MKSIEAAAAYLALALALAFLLSSCAPPASLFWRDSEIAVPERTPER